MHNIIDFRPLTLCSRTCTAQRTISTTERSHAVGALVKRFIEAKKSRAPEVIVWGTGTPVREWLFVDDGAEAMVRGIDCAPCVEPINVGVAKGMSIAELAERIGTIVGYQGRIVYDMSKPDGAPYKMVDGSRWQGYAWLVTAGGTG